MARRTATITRRDITSALSATTKKDSEPYEIGDDRCPGLSLRVRAKSASWSLRDRLGGKQSTWKIADLRPGDDPSVIRERAHHAKALLKRGVDPKSWLQEKALGGEIVRHFDEELDGWTFGQAREQYLAFIKKERAKATFIDYRKNLNSTDLEGWDDRLVKNITKRDIAELQDSIYNRGAKSQATHTLRIVKAFLNWTAQRGASGLEDSPANSVRPISLSKIKKKLTAPSLEAIGSAAWLLDTSRTNAAARFAATLALLTAQRRETIVSARKDAFEQVGDGAIWTIPPTSSKSKREHVVPLPPLAWSIVKKAMCLSRSDSPWLFPQLRVRRKGNAGDGYMSAKELNVAFKKAGSPIRPHDARRAFGTHGESLLEFSRSDTKAILDHAEGQSGDVTGEHYALHDGTHFKWRLMRQWEAFIVEQIEAQRPEGLPEALPGFLR